MANPISVPGTNVPSGAAVSPGGAQGVQGLAGTLGPVGTLPVGTVILYVAGGTPPASWMACDGSAVSRATYPDLFTAIGTTYGAGDGSTTFNLPDLQGRTPIGVGQGTGLTNRALAAKGGEETHQLVTAEIPSHTHFSVGGGNNMYYVGTNAGSGSFAGAWLSANNVGGSGSVWGVSTGAAGSDTGHNTMQPFLALFYIIKVSASGGATAQAPIADTTQPGLMRTVSGNVTDFVDGTNNSQPLQPVIWSVRLRSFQALSNSTFEVDQRNVGNTVAPTTAALFTVDRWAAVPSFTATFRTTDGQQTVAAGINVPGTNFAITRSFLRVTLTTAQATLGTSDFFQLRQYVEGPRWRELQNDVHSLQLIVRCSVAPLSFGVVLLDPSISRSLTKLCTISTPNQWQLIQLPNLPIWTAGGNFTNAAGSVGYLLGITLAAGTNLTSPANDVWSTSTNYYGATGQSNFAAQAVNSTFDIAFIQHEPGPLCTTPIDCPFGQNLDGDMGCTRYFQKTYDYTTAVATLTDSNSVIFGATGGIPYFWLPFKKAMAKSPTMTAYTPRYSAGANLVANASVGSNLSTTGAQGVGQNGFGSFIVSSPPGTAWICMYHYIADTGW